MLSARESAEYLAAEKIVSKYRNLRDALAYVKRKINKAIYQCKDNITIDLSNTRDFDVTENIGKIIEKKMMDQGYNTNYEYEYLGLSWKLEKDQEEIPDGRLSYSTLEESVPKKLMSPQEAAKLSIVKMNQTVTDLFDECQERINEAANDNKCEFKLDFKDNNTYIYERLGKKLTGFGYEVDFYSYSNCSQMTVSWETERDKEEDLCEKKNQEEIPNEKLDSTMGKFEKSMLAQEKISQTDSSCDEKIVENETEVIRAKILKELGNVGYDKETVYNYKLRNESDRLKYLYLENAHLAIDKAKLSDDKQFIELHFTEMIYFFTTKKKLEDEGYITSIECGFDDDNTFQGKLRVEWF